MRVLGIETSCDETSAALLSGSDDDARIDSLVILSQDVHRIFGGVVPEIASRAHVTAVVPVVEQAFREAGLTREVVDAIAVTNGPGLVGALLVGVSFAKALAFVLGVRVIGVHHMEGHLFATALESPEAVPPFTALLVSGGHTLLMDVEGWGQYRLLGRTRDDAAGEAFDKVAKLLGLPYPGGPAIEREARDDVGTSLANAYRFSRPMLRRDQRPGDADYYDVSFSGLKTAVLNAVREDGAATSLEPPRRAAIARAFQEALIETLVEKTARAVRQFKRERVVLGGGVAGNRTLVEAMRSRLAPWGARVFAPSPRLATDNAAMIARAGLFHLERGERSGLELNAFASIPIPGLAN
ncbi:MAG TPA: tRNA (adenosine(37)-N6)-threonylcarbamoyltransferase complex transferase subunit TsaD [Gemmatimonadaceae bacterium]|jgi:N6-L-threonylcarbamoyladenine synthase